MKPPIEFTWDDKKDKTNQKKHGVSFREAQKLKLYSMMKTRG